MRERLTAATGFAADSTFGERVLIRPRSVDQHSGDMADAARPERTVLARFGRMPETDDIGGAAPARETGLTTVAGAAAAVTLRAAVVVALGFSVRRGDKVVLVDRSGAPSYTVARVAPIHVGDVMLFVTADSPGT